MPEGVEEVVFVLRALGIDGATAYAGDELLPLYAALVGAAVLLADLYEVARRIQDRYRADGYLLTRVVIPAQTVRDGAFRLQVIEGFVSRVRVEGEVGAVGGRIRRYLNPVAGIRPLRERHLERYLLLVNDLPGITTVAVLQRGEGEPDASELIVKVRREPFDGALFAHNRGSEFTGPIQVTGTMAANSALGLGERIHLFVLGTEDDEQRFARITYQQPTGNEGLQVGAWVAYGDSEPGSSLDRLDVETESGSAGVFLRYPWIRSRDRSLYLSAGFDAVHERVEVLGKAFFEDDLRALHATVEYEFADPLGGRSRIALGLRQGLDVLGASDEGDSGLSRPEADPKSTTLTPRAASAQSLGGGYGLHVAAAGQIAFDPLLSTEEFRAGGTSFGRGYDPSELAGDHGFGLTL